MQFKRLMDYIERFTKAFEVSILHYVRTRGLPTYYNTLHSEIVNIMHIKKKLFTHHCLNLINELKYTMIIEMY